MATQPAMLRRTLFDNQYQSQVINSLIPQLLPLALNNAVFLGESATFFNASGAETDQLFTVETVATSSNDTSIASNINSFLTTNGITNSISTVESVTYGL